MRSQIRRGFPARWAVAATATIAQLFVSLPAVTAEGPRPVVVVLIDADPALGPGWSEVLSGSAVAVLELGGFRATVLRAHREDPRGDGDMPRRALADGIAAYDALKLEEAVALLSEVVSAAVAHGAKGLEPDQLSDTFLYRGMSRSALGDDTAAFSDFLRAASYAPGRALDPGRFSPASRAAYRRAEAVMSSGARGVLVVKGPPGARAWVNGGDVGTVPARLEGLPRGEHLVRVELAGRTPWTARVTLATSELELVADLRPIPPVFDPTNVAALAVTGKEHAAALVLGVSAHSSKELGAELQVLEVRVSEAVVRRSTHLAVRGDAVAAGRVLGAYLGTLKAGPPLLPSLPTPRQRPFLVRAAPWLLGGAAAIVVATIATSLAVALGGKESGFRVEVTPP